MTKCVLTAVGTWTCRLLAMSLPLSIAAQVPEFTLCCGPRNDLLLALKEAGIKVQRHDEPARAIRASGPGALVLLLAEDYPHKRLGLPEAALAEAAKKRLRLYVEYCDSLPGLTFGQPRRTPWERFVVSSEKTGKELPTGQILVAHESVVLPVSVAEPLIVVARVAGYNRAVYGIPPSAQPVLFVQPGTDILVATTRLSGFRTGRFAPAREWEALWGFILQHLAGRELPRLHWAPRVATMYGPAGQLPGDVEQKALRSAAEFYHRSHLMVPESRSQAVTEQMRKGSEVWNVRAAEIAPGDGRFGILEGYSSNIQRNGDQLQRTVIRADCQAETAMVLAMDWAGNRNRRSRLAGSNLLDFVYFNSDLCRGGRGNPTHPAFGLISWGSTAPAWMVANYGDDNARTMLATILAGACLGTDRWDKPLLRALLANLRTTGRMGFRGDRIDMPQLERYGWRHYYDGETVNYSPHFESYNWACFLWAYRQTRHREFLDRTKTGIRMMMQAYPEQWRWNDNMERARILLCLSWLAQLEDTPEHRRWLEMIVHDLRAIQHSTGALPERFRGRSGSYYQVPPTNEAYGTTETPLLQENGDPVSDQLYVSGFALLGLHEAAAVLKDPQIVEMENRLAEYLCRIQTRSRELPHLQGTWFRAFDFLRWEPWASSGDSGWGAWSVEAGWAQAWTAAVLGLRGEKRSFWDLTARSKIAAHLAETQKEFARNAGGPLQER